MRVRAIASVVLTLAVAGALLQERAAGGGPVTDIASAVQAVSSHGDTAARTAEQVRYPDKNLELLATHLVRDGALVDAATAPARDQRVWQIAQRVLPPEELAEVRQLNVVTDGPNGTLAMVHRSSVTANGWILSIDSAEPTDVLENTLVHELGHMLTLRHEDLAVASGAAACAGTRIQIGCALPGSALAQWDQQFWSGSSEPARYDAARFVSEYAATSVHEDLAESFLAYVLGTDAPITPAISAKLAYFATRPEFVHAAAEVRAQLGRT